MKFKQLDNEHVDQAWERMESFVKNCHTHGLTAWMIIQTFYARLKFSSRNLLDSLTLVSLLEAMQGIEGWHIAGGCSLDVILVSTQIVAVVTLSLIHIYEE